jgi:hypothetical protein
MAVGGNRTGVKWNLGGAKSRGKGIGIDFNVFAYYAEKLDEAGADLTKIFTEIMEMTSEEIQADTLDALADANLPAHGKYSRDQTAEALDLYPKAIVSGSIIECSIGFDKSKPGAGGFLITGTPKMRPDYKLEDIYVRKTYMSKKQKEIGEYLSKELHERIK